MTLKLKKVQFMVIKFKKALINLVVVLVSSTIGLLLCEFGARLFLNPADYLTLDLAPDKILGRATSPGTAGFDKWGFRNQKVPPTADIVAIGDSHTYGNAARMDDAWPQVLGRLTHESVYNLALGGYGPNQYYYLLKTKALELKPRVIICGFYMGDDFENAFSITYGLDYWAYLRELPVEKADFDIWEVPSNDAWHTWNKPLRLWLSRHSVIYQLVVHGPLLGRLNGETQIKHASQIYGSAVSLIIPEKHICEAFHPKGILRWLDQDQETVREGMRITFKLFKEMDETCRENNIQFIVLVIPTKEMVFSPYLEHNPKLPLSDVLDKLIANERLAREKVFKFFSDSSIRHVDPLPALQGSVEHEIYAHTAADVHPNKNGYRIMAEAIAQSLATKTVAKQSN
jgi:hypothetical protein